MEANTPGRQSITGTNTQRITGLERQPAEPVSFISWLASYGLTLADLGHTPESMEAAERDLDARVGGAS
jgi:hypothetical protein